MMKTRQDNYVTDHIGLVYIKKNIELSVPMDWVWSMTKNQARQQCDRLYRYGLHQN